MAEPSQAWDGGLTVSARIDGTDSYDFGSRAAARSTAHTAFWSGCLTTRLRCARHRTSASQCPPQGDPAHARLPRPDARGLVLRHGYRPGTLDHVSVGSAATW